MTNPTPNPTKPPKASSPVFELPLTFEERGAVLDALRQQIAYLDRVAISRGDREAISLMRGVIARMEA
jgi:hypothetical protein